MKRILLAVAALSWLLAACESKPSSAEHESAEAEHEEAEHAEGEHEEHEGTPEQTTIKADAATLAGIRVAPAAPGVIADEHQVQGLLTPVEGRIAQVSARFRAW